MKETLTYAEWMVMSALWDDDPMPLSRVIEKMGDTMDWSYRTYATYLNKLYTKGFVGYNLLGRDKFYFAKVKRSDCIKAESKSILDKVSNKGRKELLVYLIESSGLSKKDHEELAELLKNISEENRK
jgi:BlaI family penicillinase repressor